MTQRFHRAARSIAVCTASVALTAGACSSGSESAGVLEGAPADPTVAPIAGGDDDGGPVEGDPLEDDETSSQDALDVADGEGEPDTGPEAAPTDPENTDPADQTDQAGEDEPSDSPSPSESADGDAGPTRLTTPDGPDGFQTVGGDRPDPADRRSDSPADHLRGGTVETGEIVAGSDDLFPQSVQLDVPPEGYASAEFAVNREWGSLTGVAVLVSPVGDDVSVEARLTDEAGNSLWVSDLAADSAVPIDIEVADVGTLLLEVTRSGGGEDPVVFAIGAAQFEV